MDQIGVTVLEAQKLVGVNINPYVAVRVGGPWARASCLCQG